MKAFFGKRIVVGVTGSIAAYKAAELVRGLRKAGATVRVVMTKNASWFVNPLTFEVLSGNEVVSDMFSSAGTTIDHISLGQQSDLIVIAPATANIIAKIAHGLGDDFLSTLILASTANALICPAMNDKMYSNIAVQSNVSILKEKGFTVMEPGEGELASEGERGTGRLPEPPLILDRIEDMLSKKDFRGLRAMVTAGPTMEFMDPVRLITNRSSGKMGYALAEAAKKRGAEVILVTGPVYINPPEGVKVIRVITAEEMKQAVLDNFRDMDLVMKAAAVCDYRPVKAFREKEKKENRPVSIELVPTSDILAEMGRDKGGVTLVGFAAETKDHLANGMDKIRKKNLDMIVVNDVSGQDRGFGVDTNEVWIIDRNGTEEKVPLSTKREVADRILNRIRDLRNG